MEIFVQNQGMRKILPQAYNGYSEDKILSITPRLGEKIVLQKAQISSIHGRQQRVPSDHRYAAAKRSSLANQCQDE
jgi:hypothetical protein